VNIQKKSSVVVVPGNTIPSDTPTAKTGVMNYIWAILAMMFAIIGFLFWMVLKKKRN
jgi:LPXTG-motif cell wall-anchored protein